MRIFKSDAVQIAEGICSVSRLSAPDMLWAVHPAGERCHAIAPDYPDKYETLSHAEALRGVHPAGAGRAHLVCLIRLWQPG